MKRILILVVWATLCACAEERVDIAAPSGAIRVAVLPDQSIDVLLRKHEPLMDYLERSTSLDFELVVPNDYEDLLDRFDNGHVELAWFGGLTFVRAEQRSQAVPLVLRDVDLRFTSCYLAAGSDTRTMIAQFKGEKFSFGPGLSTSGHLMPRYFLDEDGLNPEQFFASVRHSDGHDQTAKWVSEGEVALGVANCIIVQSMLADGRLNSNEIHIVQTTPSYSDYVWAVKKTLDAREKSAILNAFLELDVSVPEHRALLRLQGANVYLPAGIKDFDMVRLAARRAGLLAADSEN